MVEIIRIDSMRILLTIFFGLLVSTSSAQVDFFKSKTFDEVLERAQKEDKIILLNGYTDWCGYCKKMDREVFNDKQTGNYLNHNFINVKMNMEKGEGPAIAKKYFMKGFPTTVFLEPSGKVRHRVIGYKPKQVFVKEAQKALGMDPQRLKKYQEQYTSGERDPQFLVKYINLLQLSNLPVDEPFADLLTLDETNLLNEANAKLIYSLATKQNLHAIDYIEKNNNQLLTYLSKEKMNDLFTQNALIAVVKLGKTQNDEAFKSIIDHLKSLTGNENETSIAKLSMMYYQNTTQWEKFAVSADEFIKKEKSISPQDLNNAAWMVSQHTADKAQLKKAMNWCNASISREAKYYNHDTKGWILYKLGKSKQALQAAEEAIAMAKQEKTDYSSSMNLIKKINGLD